MIFLRDYIYIFTSVIYFCVCFWQHYSNTTPMLFEDLPALFGSPLPKDGLMVRELKDAVHTEKYHSKCFIMMWGFFVVCVCVCV